MRRLSDVNRSRQSRILFQPWSRLEIRFPPDVSRARNQVSMPLREIGVLSFNGCARGSSECLDVPVMLSWVAYAPLVEEVGLMSSSVRENGRWIFRLSA